MGTKKEKIVVGILLFLIFIGSFFLRVYFPWNSVFSDPIKYTADDGVYHMRLVENMLLGGHFPSRLYFDAYTYFPYGTYIHFAPLYDWLLAAIIWLISFGRPTLSLINKIAPFYPAILGSLTVLVVYFIGKTLWKRWVGLFSAFLISVSQPFLFRSLLGATDHHQAEALFSSLAILFLILSLKSGKIFKKRQFWIYTFLAGIVLGLYFLVWSGALLFLFIIFASIILYYLIESFSGRAHDWILIMGSVIFFISLGIITPFFGTADLFYSPLYNINHLAAFLLGIMGFLITLFIGRFVRKKKLEFWYFPALLVFFGLLILFLLSIFSSSIFLGIIESFKAINLGLMSQQGELAGRGHARELIGEMKPMGIQGAIENFGYLFYLSFTSLVFIIYNFLKKREPENLLMIIWFLVIFLITGIITVSFGQVRFSYYLSINISLLCGFLGAKILLFGIKNLKKCWQDKTINFNNFRFLTSFLLIFNIIFFVFYPFPFNLIFSFPNNLPSIILDAVNTATYGAIGREPDLYETLEWLRINTPDPGVDYYGFYKEPNFNLQTGKVAPYDYPDSAYGVMATWDMGHMITYYSHRIPNANPFQQGLGRVENEIIVPGETTFFTENDEKIAVGFLEKLRTKYIITDFGMAEGYGGFHGTQLWATEGKGGYYLNEEGNVIGSTTRKYDKSMIVRLHYFDGREWQYQEEKESYIKYLDHFRLVYESKTSASSGFFEKAEDDIKSIKIFEYVKGAKIIGNVSTGTKVEISTNIKTNQEREFVYKKKMVVDNGKFEFIVPYSTFGKQGWLGNGTKFEVFANPYKLKINGIEKQINVSEKDILEGNIITVTI
ncbi:MAG: oligosaccharyl transferase, archaeosortase A system-associated [Candidatus Paceibacterota bacterium]|jgi:dolichyl-diphosphooligosaccharide--protein glycosyltransferase